MESPIRFRQINTDHSLLYKFIVWSAFADGEVKGESSTFSFHKDTYKTPFKLELLV